MASAKKKRGGNYCCVVGCHKNEGAHRPDTSFFKFPKDRNPEQHQLLLKAVNRINLDGSPWDSLFLPPKWTAVYLLTLSADLALAGPGTGSP